MWGGGGGGQLLQMTGALPGCKYVLIMERLECDLLQQICTSHAMRNSVYARMKTKMQIVCFIIIHMINAFVFIAWLVQSMYF